MKISFLISLLLVAGAALSQNKLNIVPMPAEVKMGKGSSVIRQPIGFIVYDVDDNNENDGVETFKKYLKKTYQLSRFTDGDTHSYGLPFEIHYGLLNRKEKDGYYELEVRDNRVYIKANALGKFYAFETLKQLITRDAKKQLVIPNCTIKDYPRFSYRGLHLDVARHFMPVSFVKKYVDYLAAYKFNTFHWHLTDDQGWRIEIKKYPKLTSIGGWRNGTIIGRYPGKGNDGMRHGGFYTQAQIKDVVRYAADKHIRIIPEIEMPGHASAAIAAYPQLSCFPEEDTQHPAECAWAGSNKGKQVQQTWGVFEDVFCPGEYTFKFLQDVLDEVIPLFPSGYIHIGGDECPKEAWKRSVFCQQLMKEKGLKDEHALQSYFIQRIEKYINKKGKKIIGWDEILEGGLAPNATVMSWRGEQGGIDAAKQNHDVIMTPGDWCYLDHSQTKNEDSVTIGGYLPIEKVYGYEPIPSVLSTDEAKHILGAQGNLWSEYLASPAKVEYMLFPRMAALAEVLWTKKENKEWKDFERRLPVIFERLDKQKINYSKAYYEPEISILPSADYNEVFFSVKTRQENASFYFGNKTKSIFNLYKDFIVSPVRESGLFAVRLLGKLNPEKKGEKWGIVETSPFEYLFKYDLEIHFNKATGKKITLSNPPSPNYPGSGAFTLVDGVQNGKGFAKSAEFIGFNGTDCEAIIDLGKPDTISKVTIHALTDKRSWIWQPQSATIFTSADGINFTSMGSTTDFKSNENGNGEMKISFVETSARYVKLLIKNSGEIPEGYAGAGNPAWLFLDEVEIE